MNSLIFRVLPDIQGFIC